MTNPEPIKPAPLGAEIGAGLGPAKDSHEDAQKESVFKTANENPESLKANNKAQSGKEAERRAKTKEHLIKLTFETLEIGADEPHVREAVRKAVFESERGIQIFDLMDTAMVARYGPKGSPEWLAGMKAEIERHAAGRRKPDSARLSDDRKDAILTALGLQRKRTASDLWNAMNWPTRIGAVLSAALLIPLSFMGSIIGIPAAFFMRGFRDSYDQWID